MFSLLYDNEKFLYTKEPGNGFQINDRCQDIRTQLLTDKNLTVEEQAKLFAESRLLHTKDIIEKLKQGYNVITDRYIISSFIYQGLILGFQEIFDLNEKTIKLLNDNKIKLNSIIFQISEETYEKRINNRDEEKDAMEDTEKTIILDRIDGFNRIENQSSLKNIDNNMTYTIDANGTDFDRVLLDALKCINQILKEEK